MITNLNITREQVDANYSNIVAVANTIKELDLVIQKGEVPGDIAYIGAIITTMQQILAEKAIGSMSISGAKKALSEGVFTQEEYENAIENLASNLMITRNPGVGASGELTMRFSSRVSFVINATNYVANINGDTYTVAAPFVVDSSNLIADGNQFKVLVPVRAITSTSTPNKGDVVSSNQVLARFVGAEIEQPFSAGRAKEDIDVFITRMKNALTTRDLATPAAIKTVLMDEISTITNVTTITFKDPEMTRTLVRWDVTGGTVLVKLPYGSDVYVFSKLSRIQQKYTAIDAEADNIDGVIEYKAGSNSLWLTPTSPYATILSVKNTTKNTNIPFKCLVDSDVTYEGYLVSMKTIIGSVGNNFVPVPIQIDATAAVKGDEIVVTYLNDATVDNIQTNYFTRDDAYIGTSILVKYPHVFSVLAEITLQVVKETADSVIDELKAKARATIIQYINNLYGTDNLSKAKLVSLLQPLSVDTDPLFPVIKDIPISAFTLKLQGVNRDTGMMETHIVPDIVQIPASLGNNITPQASDRTVQLMAFEEDIVITVQRVNVAT